MLEQAEKSLALAAHYKSAIDAHDGLPHRMAAIPARAKRAGAEIHIKEASDLKEKHYGLVFVICHVQEVALGDVILWENGSLRPNNLVTFETTSVDPRKCGRLCEVRRISRLCNLLGSQVRECRSNTSFFVVTFKLERAKDETILARSRR